MSKPLRPVVFSDDVPAAWLEFQMRGRARQAGEVWSRADAVRQADADRRDPKQYHPHGRPHRGRAVR